MDSIEEWEEPLITDHTSFYETAEEPVVLEKALSLCLDIMSTFETPQAMMAYTGQGLGTLSHIFHRVIQNHLCRGRYQHSRRPILINSWEAMYDPAMLYYSPQYWCSDDTDPIERLEIQYGTSFFYPVSTVGAHVSASPNHQTGRRIPLSTRGVVAMAGTFGYELNLNHLTEEEGSEIRQQIENFKGFYDVIQNGHYYRLTSPYDKQYITSWQMVSEDRKKTLVSLVCTHERANKYVAFIRLKGLNPFASYVVEGDERIYSGSALMYGGLAIPMLQGEYPSRQLYITEM